MTPTIYIDPKFTQTEEAKSFIDYLLEMYPLTNTNRYKICIKVTKVSRMHGTLYRTEPSDLDSPAASSLDARAPKNPVPLADLYSFLAHEHCHAMQNDQRFDIVNTKGKRLCEIHADLFGLQRAAEKLGTSAEDIMSQTVTYQQTKDHIKLHGSIEAALNNMPKLDKLKSWSHP